MTLGELIKYLEKQDQDKILPIGFGNPHSYRGYYECLAFEPVKDIKCSEMLQFALSANGAKYCGWRGGGKFAMTLDTEIFIANQGDCGENVTELLLKYMFNDF